jgi:hypothetical protein
VELAERLSFIASRIGRIRGDGVIRVDPNDRVAVLKAKAAIKERYKAWDEKKFDRSGDGTHVLTVLRVCQLESYLRLRYGAILPDDDAGREDLVILLNHAAHNRDNPQGKMIGFIRRWAPWMAPAEAEALGAMILEKPRLYSPKRLGELLRLTERERDLIGGTTIRPVDETTGIAMTDAEMEENAKRKDREYHKAKRDTNRSGRPRGRPKSAGPKAWEAAGASSKAAHYRNRKKAAAPGETKNESEALEYTSCAPDGISLPTAAVISEPSAERPKRDGAVIEVLELAEAELLPETRIILPPQPAVIDLVPIPKAQHSRLALARRPNHAGRATAWAKILYEREQQQRAGDMQ